MENRIVVTWYGTKRGVRQTICQKGFADFGSDIEREFRNKSTALFAGFKDIKYTIEVKNS